MLPILGDAGAHVSQIMDVGWVSFVLSYWVREQELFPIGEAIRRMTSLPARLVGLADRATLLPGMRADVNVLDPERVAECMPELVHDFPGGAPRFLQRSCGYRATLVNGEISVEEGELTGARAGCATKGSRSSSRSRTSPIRPSSAAPRRRACASSAAVTRAPRCTWRTAGRA
jgi:N-acyl-D-aspartate/D-glutamate deacylase